MQTNLNKLRQLKRNQAPPPPLTREQRAQVRQMIEAKIERKAFAFSTGFIAVTTAGTTTRLTGIASGSGRVQRVGDLVTVKKLSFRYVVQVGATGLIAAADQYNTVRVIVFRWLEDDGAVAPVTSNILSGLASSNVTLQNYNYDDKQLYQVLHDKTHVVFNTPIWNGSAAQWQHGVEGTFVTPETVEYKMNSPIEFDFDNIQGTGHLYVLLVSDSAFTPNPSIEFVAEVEYLDG